MIKIALFVLLFFNFNLVFANKLYIYGWFNSIPDHVLEKFTKETGINIIFSSYENNETMYAKLKLLGKRPSYDIVFPSTYFIQKMVKEDLLEAINKAKISNIKNEFKSGEI